MSEELYFNNELRECLDAAGYSDCGENDQWNYWYQRLHKAHDAAVDRVTETQRAEIAKLLELVRGLDYCARESYGMCARTPVGGGRPFTCCPLYDFDTKEYRCEKLKHELGVDA